MKKSNIIIALAGSLILIGCGSSKTFINQDYIGKKFTDDSLIFIDLNPSQVRDITDNDFKDDFPEIEQEKKNEYLSKEIIFNLKEAFSRSGNKVSFDLSKPNLELLNGDRLQLVEKDFKEAKISIKVPTKEEFIQKRPGQRFGIAIGDAIFNRNESYKNDLSYSNPVFSNSGNALQKSLRMEKYLGLTITYVVYDYINSKIVAIGETSEKSEFNFAMTKSDWQTVIKRATGIVVENSTFFKVKY